MRYNIWQKGLILFLLFAIYRIADTTAPVSICQSNSNRSGLIALWHLNTNSTSQPDATGNNHTGTVIGSASYTTGKFGGAYVFPSYPSYIQTDFTGATLNYNITVIAWIYPTDISTNRGIMGCADSNPWQGWYFRISYSKLQYHINGGGAEVYGNTPVTLNTWHQAAFTRTTGEFCLYLDGVLDKKQSFSSGNPGTRNVVFGAVYYEGGEHFYGKIDEVAIYNRVLSDAEINFLYYNNPKVMIK